MKRSPTTPLILCFLLAITFSIPQITLAAWWNPSAWPWVEKFIYELTNSHKQTHNQSVSTSSVNQIAATTSEPVTNLSNTIHTISSYVTRSSSSLVLSNAQIIARDKTSVVYIKNDSQVPITGEEELGSGMIISTNGYVLTNAHVVKKADAVTVNLADGSSYIAPVVGRDENVDLAIIKLPSNTTYTSIDLGNSDTVNQGDNVYALGFPFGIQGDVDFTNGVLSRIVSIDGTDYLEETASFHPGSSGGPLVNQEGQVIGINSDQYYDNAVEQLLGAGSLNLSIPINVAIALIPKLENGLQILTPDDSQLAQPATSLIPLPPSSKTARVNDWPVYVDQSGQPILSSSGHEIIAAKVPPVGVYPWSGGGDDSLVWTDVSTGNVYAVPASPKATEMDGLWLNPNDNNKYLIPSGGYPTGTCTQYGQSGICFESFLEQ